MACSRVLILAPITALLLNASLAPVTTILLKLFDTLGGQATGYGTFVAFESLGLMGAGLLVVAWGERRSPQGVIATGLGLTACAYGVMWAWPQPEVLTGTTLILGLDFGSINTPFQTLLHRQVPEAYLGRVFSVLGMVSSVGMPLSLLPVSPVLDRLPLTLWFAMAALAQGVGGVVWLLGVRTEGHHHTVKADAVGS